MNLSFFSRIYLRQTFTILFSLTATSLFFVHCDYFPKPRGDKYFRNSIVGDFHYDLLKPENRFFMTFELEEISGLSWNNSQRLACIQDEAGVLFLYDLKEEEISHRLKFNHRADYEGVEIINGEAWVVESDGDLYNFKLSENDEVKSVKYETPLGDDNNVEGLGYDPKNGILLLACKGDGDLKKNKVKGKAVYGWDIKNETFLNDHVLSIDEDQIDEFLDTHDKDDEDIDFEPSGIALHPLEDRYYIITYSGLALLIVDRSMKIEEYIRLDPKIFRQPEGICFSPEGKMYIASEGRGGVGYILSFNYKNSG